MSRQKRLAAYRAATACARQRNAAATLAQAAQDLHRETLDLSLRCMSADHGSEQSLLLQGMCIYLGTSAEIAAQVPGEQDNALGLHQALALVLRMARADCAWDAAWAASLQLALEICSDIMLAHPRIAMQLMPTAARLAADVREGCVHPDAIAPVEEPL
jgi:hypothetical protein